MAIDPGMAGGIALRDRDGNYFTVKLPREAEDMQEVFSHLWATYPAREWHVFLENPPLFTGANLRSSHIGKMYGSYKFCQGYLIGAGVKKLALLHPIKWQNLVGCRNSRGLARPQWKAHLANHARKLFPDRTVTMWDADALLILAAGLKLVEEGSQEIAKALRTVEKQFNVGTQRLLKSLEITT